MLRDEHPLEFNSWRACRSRCNNPKDKVYRFYGGRGIKVCGRWKSFQNFLDDMGLKPFPKAELDRKDTNGNYCKANCRWVTKGENLSNMRNNHWITHNGVKKTQAQWARKLKMSPMTVGRRARAGKDLK